MFRRVVLLVPLAMAPVSSLAAQAAGSRPGRIPRPAAKYEFSADSNVMIPMRDGVRLATDVYHPAGLDGKQPVILMRTPYGKKGNAPALVWAGQGYTVAVQDVRGRGGSEGKYEYETADRDDGYDTIDWIVKQPWSNGRVGTYGCSYLGEVQYLLEKRHHPNHAAAIAQAPGGAVGPAGGYYSNGAFTEGGAITLSSTFGWFGSRVAGPQLRGGAPVSDIAGTLRSLPLVEMGKRAGYAPSELEQIFASTPAAEFWDRKGYLTDADQFDTPTLHTTSWLDPTPDRVLYAFNLMSRNALTSQGRDNQFVIVSPTTHCVSESGTEHTVVGAMDVGDARFDYWKVYLDWFDHWLKGVDNGVTAMPKVRYYAIGEGKWRTAASWPPREVKVTPFYLTSGGRSNTSSGDGVLAVSLPSGPGHDSYVYDPGNPVPSRGGTICCTGDSRNVAGIFDQADIESSRPDILVYSTPPLREALAIAGSVKAALYVSSDARDTDFAVRLLDVDSAGHSWNVLNGVLRARYREGMTRKVLMQPGMTYRVDVDLKATAYRFAPGHRIRLWVTSSDFPLYDRNLNTGGNNYDESTWVKATNRIHHEPGAWSQLLLPVIP